MQAPRAAFCTATFDGIMCFTGFQRDEFKILLERILFAENFKLLNCIELVSNCEGDRRSIHNVDWTRNCVKCGCMRAHWCCCLEGIFANLNFNWGQICKFTKYQNHLSNLPYN